MAKKNKISESELKEYQNKYDEKSFWAKIKNYGKSAGKNVIGKALLLYYAALSDKTPIGIKTLIYGALGYFIFPIDLISDFFPVVGYTDDLAALAVAIASASAYITPEVKKKAKAQLEEWFDDVSDSDIDD